MFFFLKLALGNIFKDARSTVTILVAIFISVFAMELTFGYMEGFKLKLKNEALRSMGHVRIYEKQYYNNLDFAPIEKNILWNAALKQKIESVADVTNVRAEINFGVMANSGYSSQESMVQAIDLKSGGDIYDKLIKSVSTGRFIEKDNDVVIGVKMAKLLKLGVGDKVIMLGMDQYGGINAVEGKITGLFRNFNPADEEGLIICPLALAQKLLAMPGAVTEITVNITDPFSSEKAVKELGKILPPELAEIPWQKEQGVIEFALRTMDMAVYIMAGLIIFVAGLGIINSFLMNVMGRMPGFGVLRAMGLGRNQLFMMILAESFLQGILGTIAGLIPGISLVYYFQVHPLNYEAMGDVLSTFKGLDSLIGTALTPGGIIVAATTGILISVLACLYPAFIAVTRKPVDILRVLE